MDEQNQYYSQQGDPNQFVQQRDPNQAVMSLGQWIVTLIVQVIPCVGIIMMFVWAFGNGNENRKNYCRASLIFTAVAIVLGIISYGTIIAMVMSMAGY